MGRAARRLTMGLALILSALAVAMTTGPGSAAGEVTPVDPLGDFSASATSVCYPDEVLADSPSGYWRMNDTAGTTMAAAAGTSGSYAGGVQLSRPAAFDSASNHSVGFDGLDAEATVPDGAGVDTGDTFTYEAWIKTAPNGDEMAIVSKGPAMPVFSVDGSGRLSLFKYGAGEVAHASVPISAATWRHVAVTKNGSLTRVYVDGVETTVSDSNQTMVDNNAPLDIGATDSFGEWFRGQIDEVAVYPTALSPARIFAHYEAAACDVTAPSLSFSTPASGAHLKNGSAIGATAGDGSGSGVASVAFRYCPGTSCLWSSGTPIGAADTSSPFGVTWSSQPGDGTYTLAARATDNAGNITDRTRTVTVDNTPATPPVAGTPEQPPFIDAPGSPEPVEPSEASPVQISPKPIRLGKNGVAPVRVRCSLATTCRGTVTLVGYQRVKVERRRKGHAAVAAPARAKTRLKRVVLGRKHFRIAAGRQATVNVRVSRRARRKVLRKRSARCKITVSVGDQRYSTTGTIRR